ncbi:hypothetical protein [Ornithinimicrobium tianjinense]|nr:hypothetical protein [Ornithinimicrobium tianjinense]
MQFSRLTAVVTLSSALLVTACTGAQDGSDGVSTTSASGASDTATSTEGTDAGAATSAPAEDDAASTTTAMTTDESAAVLSVEEAEQVATTLLANRQKAYTTSQQWIKKAQQKAYMSTARTAAAAEARLARALDQKVAAAEDPGEANVLAISREDGKRPIFLFVQSVPKSGVPVLHLMESRTGETKDFRIIWEASMLPGTEIPTFDRRSVGTPVLRSGKGDLVEAPRDVLKKLAAFISYPQPEDKPDYKTNGYAAAVRKAASKQADAVSDQASLREKNWLVSEDTKVLMFEDGSALVLGALLRDTTFDIKDNAVLNAPDTFRVFTDDGELTDQAVLRTSVFVAMRVPSKETGGEPVLLAAREQLVDAWGS